MLNNPLGVFSYLLLRNDWAWYLLSETEKEQILSANKTFNTERPDFANPEMYGKNRKQEGENWDSFVYDKSDFGTQLIQDILDANAPCSVLEIGPGAGYYTRMICEYESVRFYTAVDICKPFLDYLAPRLDAIKKKKNSFCFELFAGNFTELSLQKKHNLIVLLSTVHHIPNRLELFKWLGELLTENGIILCIDPAHYLLRIRSLLKNCLFGRYLKKEFYLCRENLSTHHMCTVGEYKKIQKRLSNIQIERLSYDLPQKVKRRKLWMFSNLWFSTNIGVVFRKKL